LPPISPSAAGKATARAYLFSLNRPVLVGSRCADQTFLVSSTLRPKPAGVKRYAPTGQIGSPVAFKPQDYLRCPKPINATHPQLRQNRHNHNKRICRIRSCEKLLWNSHLYWPQQGVVICWPWPPACWSTLLLI